MKKRLSLLLSVLLVISAFALPTLASAEGEKTVYVILKVLGNQYWSVLQAGAEKAGADLGVNVVITGVNTESDVEGQITLLQNAVSAQAAGIVIGPVDSTAMADSIMEAYEAGVPVVLVDTTVVGDAYSAELMTDNVQAGRMAAEQMLKMFVDSGVSEDEESLVAIQMGSAGSQTITDRIQGFTEYWDENAPENWKILKDDMKINDGDISKAVGFCQDFLTTYENLKAVFGPNNGSTVGFVTGLTEAARTDIIMVGFDFSPEIEGMIRSGEFTVASVVQRQYFMGYEGVKLAVDLADGVIIEEQDKSIDTGVILVTAENVDADDVKAATNRPVE